MREIKYLLFGSCEASIIYRLGIDPCGTLPAKECSKLWHVDRDCYLVPMRPNPVEHHLVFWSLIHNEGVTMSHRAGKNNGCDVASCRVRGDDTFSGCRSTGDGDMPARTHRDELVFCTGEETHTSSDLRVKADSQADA